MDVNGAHFVAFGWGLLRCKGVSRLPHPYVRLIKSNGIHKARPSAGLCLQAI